MKIQGTKQSLKRTKWADSHFLILKPTTKLQQSRQCGANIKTGI